MRVLNGIQVFYSEDCSICRKQVLDGTIARCSFRGNGSRTRPSFREAFDVNHAEKTLCFREFFADQLQPSRFSKWLKDELARDRTPLFLSQT